MAGKTCFMEGTPWGAFSFMSDSLCGFVSTKRRK